MMPPDDPAAPGLARAQLARANELVDRLPGHAQYRGSFIDAVSKSLRLSMTWPKRYGSDRRT
jgi:hypothetical protein